MSHITYDGVVAGAQGGGNIFQGKRFWVAQRVPIRSSIINHIKSNGGIVEMQEKKADFLIADHARKDSPAGSYSWTMIEDSVKHGIMQLTDRYCIDMMQGNVRPAGSEGPAKRSRTSFTHADDVMLAKWVLENKADLQGNKSYQELEKSCPRHTWQSWRNRYIKSLSVRGQEYLVKLASEELPGDNGGPSGTPNREDDGVSNNGSEGEAQSGRPESSENDRPVSEAGKFYSNLEAFYEDDDIPIQHVIGDKVVELWDLWNAILKQELPAEKLDWKLVAKGLDHGWDCEEPICAGLRECFEKHLVEFFEVLWESPSTKNVGNADQAELQATNSEERADPIPGSLPSSPPQTPCRKRSRDADTVEASAGAKRQRRCPRDVEIPSTPEEKIGLSRRLPTAPDASSANDQLPWLPCGSERAEEQESPSPSQQLLSESKLSDMSPTTGEQKTPVAEEAPAKATPRRRSPRSLGCDSAVLSSGENTKASGRSMSASNAKRSPGNQQRRKRPRKSAVGSGSELGKGEQAVMEKVQHYVSLGYPERIVVEALKSTSMRPGGAASYVMQSLKDGKGMPTNVEGAWTERDDGDLLWADEVKARGSSASAAEVKKANDKHDRLDHKHGIENLKLRRQFVADLALARRC